MQSSSPTVSKRELLFPQIRKQQSPAIDMRTTLGSPSTRSFDHLKPPSGSGKNFSFSSPRPASDNQMSLGNFTNPKSAAEKLVKEQVPVKMELETANNKLKKSIENVRSLEEKLQNAFNENLKLKLKQNENEKLWEGLESKFASTKLFCDQHSASLRQLSGQVELAEKDTEFFQGKLSANSNAIDKLSLQLNDLFLKLSSTEGTLATREKELADLRTEKEEVSKVFVGEKGRLTKLIEDQDGMLKQFEASLTAKGLDLECLNSKLESMHLELKLKEDEINNSSIAVQNLGEEKSDLQLSNEKLANELATALQEIMKLENFVNVLTAQLVELDEQSLSFTDNFNRLSSLYDASIELAQRESALVSKHAQKQYNMLHNKFLETTSEMEALQLTNTELNSKIPELEKALESLREKLAEEQWSAVEKINKLESEAETLLLKKDEAVMLVSKLEEKTKALSESSRSSENETKELLLKMAKLEEENRGTIEQLQGEIQKKLDEIDNLKKEAQEHDQETDYLTQKVDELLNVVQEKEELILQVKEREKNLEDKINENQASLTAADGRLAEVKKQYEMMLESKQLELSRHLNEISLRNDQAITEIRRKYDEEKLEIINTEKEKVNKQLQDMERNCELKLSEQKEESKQQLVRIQEEHAAMILQIKQDNDNKETSLKARHSEELKRAESEAKHAETEKIASLRSEHEAQMKTLRSQYEDVGRKLQDELDLQRDKEDKQRALLEMQLKVMSNNRGADQEVNSNKEHSVSSVQMLDHRKIRKSPRSLARPESAKRGKAMGIPMHTKKVSRPEYEFETADGATIAKRRKTKTTAVLEGPVKHSKRGTPKAVITPRTALKRIKGSAATQPHRPSNIGDLFSEGSLNPYADDDPYAFV
ncbi:unnamed protein product [Linum trigynum]|uniref:Synaptonemal complex protein 1 n=2 Tax=Linum trigynum TaxID=586398 RepID=A0AAV2FIC3_9ROSI